MDLAQYSALKAAGLISIALDSAKRDYVLRSKRWNPATGQLDTPQEESVSLTTLRKKKAALKAELAEVDKLIDDVVAFVTGNPLR